MSRATDSLSLGSIFLANESCTFLMSSAALLIARGAVQGYWLPQWRQVGLVGGGNCHHLKLMLRQQAQMDHSGKIGNLLGNSNGSEAPAHCQWPNTTWKPTNSTLGQSWSPFTFPVPSHSPCCCLLSVPPSPSPQPFLHPLPLFTPFSPPTQPFPRKIFHFFRFWNSWSTHMHKLLFIFLCRVIVDFHYRTQWGGKRPLNVMTMIGTIYTMLYISGQK